MMQRQVIQLRKIRNMSNKGIEEGAVFCFENFADPFSVENIGAEAVNRFCGKGDNTPSLMMPAANAMLAFVGL